MRRYDLASGIFLLTVGCLIVWGSLKLPVGTFGNPGEGLVPLLAGGILGILALALVVQSFSRTSSDRKSFLVGAKEWRKVVVTLFAIVIYAIVLPHAGFLILSFLLMLFMFKAIGGLNWKFSFLGATLTVVFTYLLFQVWLKVQFPRGPWGF
jgi:hypothetical protein